VLDFDFSLWGFVLLFVSGVGWSTRQCYFVDSGFLALETFNFPLDALDRCVREVFKGLEHNNKDEIKNKKEAR
jgi:hypothetical protein